jgi:hypothetical protein
VLFVLTGSSAAGKTAVLEHVGGRVGNLAVHDFDEVGVPAGADTAWRQRATEAWVGRALRHQRRSTDTLVAGQTPLGEWLAVPSITRVDGIASCLLDVSPDVLTDRLASRPRGPTDPNLEDLIAWAAWHRAHALDPQHRRDVLTRNGWEAMRWKRWEGWARGDPRWRSCIVETYRQTLPETAEKVREWIAESRRLHTRGDLPLSGRWWDGAFAAAPEASRSHT